jgi:hypothetical protein
MENKAASEGKPALSSREKRERRKTDVFKPEVKEEKVFIIKEVRFLRQTFLHEQMVTELHMHLQGPGSKLSDIPNGKLGHKNFALHGLLWAGLMRSWLSFLAQWHSNCKSSRGMIL